jgi:iron complex transport system substrate-binding protein
MPNPPRRRAITRIAVSFLLAFTTAFSAAFAATAAPPQRIISMSPGTTEILFALGLGSRVVGDTTYCDYPPAAKLKPHIGNVDVDYEAIVGLRPDLVIADKLANEQSIPRLKALHIPYVTISVRSIAEVEQTILSIAKETGTETAGSRLVAQMNGEEAHAEAIAKEQSGLSLRTLIVAGTDPLYVAGPDTFIGEMIGRLGAVNVAGKSGFAPMSKESAIAADPQVVFCGSDDAAAIERDPAWAATTAVQRHNLFTVDSSLIFRPGPRLGLGMVVVASDLARARR